LSKAQSFLPKPVVTKVRILYYSIKSQKATYTSAVSKKTRTLMQEDRFYQNDWEEKIFQVEKDGKVCCLLWLR